MSQIETTSVESGDLTLNERFRIFGILGLILASFVFFALWPPRWLQSIEMWVNTRAVWSNLPIWYYILITLVDVHITTACVSLFLHRCQTHGSITFNRFVGYAMEFWLWIFTAMATIRWVAVHRKHHAKVETDEDPHSPVMYGVWRVFFYGTKLYHHAAYDEFVLRKYGKGIARRWFYLKFSLLGPVIAFVLNLWLFGIVGFPMWLVEMVWIPGFAAGVINGLGHWWGYRNFDTPDNSRNLPSKILAILTCGESSHNNHHYNQNSPKFSVKKGEIDLGWYYSRALEFVGLAHNRNT
ncbi:MAG: hypothetical protein A2735_01315 [Candidatus Yanofskybacteria bacterium RIFCSPHIGHO2_01_FULL_41_21]|uniref:Fatty acid desaturase domain-containing protein n=1 Tax=Candidatus Yanofskybacteria bacterium RIFCSPHIGHO2_01_FULL_41_21 TaxID=1802660 RepID=A0A1F8EBQ9_9BACT|nr:MAG: hypothetical protein A2735_01315 [Candidatus Yanofskybacteria bacterium RIFCSPHIGHO2_01_FULL_41_21]